MFNIAAGGGGAAPPFRSPCVPRRGHGGRIPLRAAARGDGADPDVDRIGTGRRAPDRDPGPNRWEALGPKWPSFVP